MIFYKKIAIFCKMTILIIYDGIILEEFYYSDFMNVTYGIRKIGPSK